MDEHKSINSLSQISRIYTDLETLIKIIPINQLASHFADLTL